MEWTYVFSPSATFQKHAELRLRPVPEWESCLVYTPHKPNVFILNLTAWIILDLCEGQSGDTLLSNYLDSVSQRLSRDEAIRNLDVGLGALLRDEIIERAEGRDTTETTETPVERRLSHVEA